MQGLVRFVLPNVLALGLATWAFPAGATHNADSHSKMSEDFTSGNLATNSDLAFWGDYAFVGYYTGGAGVPPRAVPRGGARVLHLADAALPRHLRGFAGVG